MLPLIPPSVQYSTSLHSLSTLPSWLLHVVNSFLPLWIITSPPFLFHYITTVSSLLTLILSFPHLYTLSVLAFTHFWPDLPHQYIHSGVHLPHSFMQDWFTLNNCTNKILYNGHSAFVKSRDIRWVLAWNLSKEESDTKYYIHCIIPFPLLPLPLPCIL